MPDCIKIIEKGESAVDLGYDNNQRRSSNYSGHTSYVGIWATRQYTTPCVLEASTSFSIFLLQPDGKEFIKTIQMMEDTYIPN